MTEEYCTCHAYVDTPCNLSDLDAWCYEHQSWECRDHMAPTSIPEAPSRVAYPEIQALDIHLSPESAGKIRKHLQRLADITLSRSEKAELDTLISEIPI